MADLFFTFLRKTLIGTLALLFAFAFLYTPQDYTALLKTEEVLALDPDPDIPSITALTLLEGNREIRETPGGLNNIAWIIAKTIVSSMVASTVDWINSGFQGSPAFVRDLDGFLLDTLDREAFQIIEKLGGDGSFLCTPFRLQIQIALSQYYDNRRAYRPYRGCSVSNFIGNFEDFISGRNNRDFLRNWVTLTSNPEKYTPYGQFNSARYQFDRQLAERDAREREILRYGSGFQSAKVCEEVESASGRTNAGERVTVDGVENADTSNFNGGFSNLNVSADSVQNADTSNFNGGFSSLSTPSQTTTSGAGSPSAATQQGLGDDFDSVVNNISPTEANNPVGDATRAISGAVRTVNNVSRSISGGNSLYCAITKPGRMIADQLTSQLNLGPNSLITADEVGEIIGALFSQLANKAITGAAGLLGLSAGTGYTYGGYQGGSYFGAQNSEQFGARPLDNLRRLEDALTVQVDILLLADERVPSLRAFILDPRTNDDRRRAADYALRRAEEVQQNAPRYIDILDGLVRDYEALLTEYENPNLTNEQRNQILREMSDLIYEFSTIQVYTKAELISSFEVWDVRNY